MTRDGEKLIKFANENDTLSCVWLIPGFRGINLPHSGEIKGSHLVIFPQLDKLISFSSLSFKEDIEDEEPWAPQDIRGAVS